MNEQQESDFSFSFGLRLQSFPMQALVVFALGVAISLCSVSLLAQRWKPLPDSEHEGNIRLRQEWFYQQRAYPHKRIPPGMRMKALEQLRKMQALQRARNQKLQQAAGSTLSTTTGGAGPAAGLSTAAWTLMGPQPTSTPFAYNPVSGRVTALAVDPTNSNVVYAGGAEGGVWKTTDGGSSWTPLTDNQPSLAVGSIALDPSNPQTIYVGTGEENFALDNYEGAGILKSSDGGSTWTQLKGPFVGPFNYLSPFCGGAYIGSIAVDPSNSQIVLAGAAFQCSSGSGIYRSTNGGLSWTLVTSSTTTIVPTSVFFDPSNSNTAYAATFNAATGSGGGVLKSTNAGLSWIPDNGFGATSLPTSSAGQVTLAIAPSSPSTLYAGVTSAASGSTALLGVYKSTDGGADWTQLASAPQYCSASPETSQCYYDNVVAVAPSNPNLVLLGGSVDNSSSGYAGTLFLSLDGGVTWTDITTDSGGNALHPDMHAVAFSKDGSKMYVGNDGGVWSTPLNSAGIGTWSDLNQPLALSQFYPGLSMDPTNPNLAFGGTQDNGVQEYDGNLTWGFVGCGDGGQTAFNYSDLNTLYISCQYTPPNTDGSGNPIDFLYKLTANPPAATPADSGIDGTDRGAFIPPFTMDPSNPNILYFGTYRVYQTTDGANSWLPISNDLTTGGSSFLSTVSAIAVAPSSSDVVYAGTADGHLWVTNNATSGANWQYITNGVPNRSVTAIAVNPTKPQTAYATFSGYSGFNSDTLGHVFETINGGSTWMDISANLPNVPVNDIVVDPDFPNMLFIATDVGVFDTTNLGASWAPLGTGLPSVVILSLKLQHATRLLRAASHGRSAWQIQLPAPVGPTAVLSTPTLDFPPQLVGTTSTAHTVTLTNNSSSPLSISSMAASSGFAETNTCGTSLAAGANCAINVTFTPTVFGPQTGQITVNDNAASGSPQTINLSGKGFSGAVSLSPSSLSFGNQLVGTTSAAQTVTLTNSSTAPLTITGITSANNFAATTDCPISPATLAGGASCHINVTFSATQMGQVTQQVTVTDSAEGGTQVIPVTGNGTQGVLALSPPQLNFNQLVGSSMQKSVTVSNGGTGDLTITSISSLASPYSQSIDCPLSPSTIPPGGSCTLTVTFAPDKWGSYDGQITFQDNGINQPQYLPVDGSAYSGAATINPSSLSFGTLNVGQTATQTATLTNSGSLPLYIFGLSGPSGTGSGVSETNNCPLSPSGLAAGASCTFTFTFTPPNPETLAMQMSIADSAQGFGQTISLSGTGAGAGVSLVPPGLDFYGQIVGTTSSLRDVQIYNYGNQNLTFNSINVTGENAGDFAIVPSATTCSTSTPVAPNASCQVAVTFGPTAGGTRNANVTIADNAYDSPQNATLYGPGEDFALAVASGSDSSATVSPGGSATYALTLAPEGGFNQRVTLACSGTPFEAGCIVAPASPTLDGTTVQDLTVKVTTTAGSLAAPGLPGGPPAPGGLALYSWWVGLLLMASLLLVIKRRGRASFLAGALLLATLALSCGGGGGASAGGGTTSSTGTPTGTYTLTVTATSGSLSHQTTLKLTVQ